MKGKMHYSKGKEMKAKMGKGKAANGGSAGSASIKFAKDANVVTSRARSWGSSGRGGKMDY